MPAYVTVQIEIEDRETYKEYIQLSPASIEAHGGRFIVRGGATETLEGDWSPERFVILEFPTVEAAKRWWSSPEYAEAKAMRQRSSRTQMLVVEGVAGAS